MHENAFANAISLVLSKWYSVHSIFGLDRLEP